VAAYIERALDFGTHKIDCIKVIRSYFDYGLKEAKDLSEAGPNTLVSRESNKAYAQEFVKAIQKVGSGPRFDGVHTGPRLGSLLR
jgi:ribosomal protein L7/L12